MRDGILNVAFLPREPVGQPRTSASAVAGVAGAAEMPADFGGGGGGSPSRAMSALHASAHHGATPTHPFPTGGGGSPSEGSSSTYRSAFHGGAASLQVQVRPSDGL